MEKLKTYWFKWQNLSGYAKFRFLHAAVTLLLVKTGLTVLPFQTFRKLFHWITDTKAMQEMSSVKIEETVKAVNMAANVLPFALLCLPRALATKYLLRKVPSLSLEIGIEINPHKAFEAHAWVEKEGKVIIGDWSGSVSYQRLWVWE
ncbi:lasso peptide biosynthesis B2 protein [Dyadobacter diqingensis]|uniref:lasso peptide biosynthesis B2 protein n=1 Tax=Dyadobacter diqingensis TaxID=2938121 RepID=UPI0020C2A4A0|nr:lasso peptide biosynthesis B2 protein [Dyadobacter diqingensis]